MPPNILLFYCSNLWALTTSAPKFLPGLLLTPQRGILHTSKCVSHFPNRQAGRPVKKHLYTSKRAPFPPRLLLAPKSSTAPTFSAPNYKGGYLYTPQIKFGRILNNSRLCRLCGVFLRRRHSAFLQIAPITALPPVPAAFFLQMPRISPPPLRPLSKTIQPAFAAFCPVSKLHPFFAPYIFPAQISRLAKLHPFSHFSFVCKKQHFFACRNFKGVFGFFYFRTCLFKKQHLFCACQKSSSILTTQKEGGFFILSHQNSTLN